MKNLQAIKNFFVICSVAIFLLCPTSIVLALSAQAHIPEKYTDVKAGERLYFELEIRYPENPARKDLRLEYEIVKDDEVIAKSKFLKAVETQASFMDYVVIPESAKEGLYEIRVQVKDYDKLSEEVSASFKVVTVGDGIRMYFYIIIGLIIALGIIISWEINIIKKSA